MPVSFKGTAHPPPRRDGKRDNPADMNGAEIGSTNLGKGRGTSLLYEHDPSHRVGRVLASWEGPGGELRVNGVVDDAEMEHSVRSGQTRGLSLGHTVLTGDRGQRLSANRPDELSLCDEPRRGGCYVTEVDGKVVHGTANFSRRGACASRP